MKGAILLYGITRGNGKVVSESLESAIYSKLKTAGHDLTIYQHVFEVDSIDNPRSKVGEHGTEIEDKKDWKHFNASQTIFENQTKYDLDTDWDDVLSDCNIHFKCGHSISNLKNMYRQMHSLETVYGMIENKSAYDYYFILRQDLLYTLTENDKMLDSINNIQGNKTPCVDVPGWGAPYGVNDRIAITNKTGADVYCNRWRYINTCPEGVSSEVFLEHVLNNTNTKHNKFRQVGKRLRANGEIEKFDKKL